MGKVLVAVVLVAVIIFNAHELAEPSNPVWWLNLFSVCFAILGLGYVAYIVAGEEEDEDYGA